MAENTDPEKSKAEAEQMYKVWKEAMDKFGTKTKSVANSINELDALMKQQAAATKKGNRTLEEEIEDRKRLELKQQSLQKTYVEEFKKFKEDTKKQVKQGEITEKQRLEMLDGFTKQYEDQVNKLKNDDLKVEFARVAESARKTADRQEVAGAIYENAAKGIKGFTENALKPAAAMAGALASSYQQGSGQVGIATSILQTGVQSAGDMMSRAGGAASTAGEAMSKMGGRGKVVGLALQGVGTAASLFGSTLSTVAQKVIPFLTTELEKNIGAFQGLSASGALFSNGLTGMIQTAGTAGLTLKQFEGFVKNNSVALAGLGEGVQGGAKRAANALQAGGDSMRKNLLNLGYSIEDQAGLVAETMRDMRQAGGPLKATDSQIAAQTQKYAENLRVIASITGEDAKKKMDQARQDAQDLAFQQKLQGMSNEQQADIIAAMGNMNEIERKAFQEMVTFGQVITPSLAATVSQSGALQEKLNATMGAYQSNTLNAETFQNLGKEYNERIKKDMLDLTGLAQAGAAGVGGIVSDMYKSLGTIFKDMTVQTPEAIAAAQEAAKKQGQTQDNLTSSMNEVVVANQKVAMEIQKAILDSGVMTGYANAVKGATDAMLGMIKQFKGENGGPDGGKTEEQKAAESRSGALEGAMQGAMLGAVLGPWGAAGGALIGGIYGALKNRSTEDIGKAMGGVGPNPQTSADGLPMYMPGAAGGGIMSGPSQGYPVMLHGREMVIPLPNDLGANDVKKAALDQLTSSQSTSPDAFLAEAMLANDKIAQALNDPMVKLSMQMEELIRFTKDIVDNTERTARGVA